MYVYLTGWKFSGSRIRIIYIYMYKYVDIVRSICFLICAGDLFGGRNKATNSEQQLVKAGSQPRKGKEGMAWHGMAWDGKDDTARLNIFTC